MYSVGDMKVKEKDVSLSLNSNDADKDGPGELNADYYLNPPEKVTVW